MIKTDNQSDKHLTVAGLTVLGDVQSNNLSQLQRQVQNNFDKTQNLTAQQKDFWSELANDNIITAVEKKQLKQELAVITQTHTSIINLASEKGEQDNPLIMMYDAKYGDLLDYINKIKLFDEMAKSTNVDKTEFTKKFTEYYDSEIVAQSIFTGKTAATIRVLNSLFETGTMNEVATYRGVFYKWNGKQWVLVNGNEYLGMFDHLPEADINDYFLCGIDFEEKLTLKANGKSLLADGKILQVNFKFEKGYVYISTDKGWKKIENKSDYRYFLITNDLISIGEMSPGLENAISTGQPRYLGLFYELPTEYRKNDWFTYAGITTEYFIQGRVYKWNGEEWEEVTAESKNYQMLMTSLTDIINANPSEQGYFTAIFAQALIASNAFIQNLQSQIITLTQALNEDGTPNENTGIIQSKNYLETNGKEGWQIRADGKAEFKHITLDYIKSEFAALKNSKFSGELECGNLIVKPTLPTKTIKIFDTFENTTDNYLFAETRLMYLELFDVPTDKNGYNHLTNITVTRMPQTLFGENTKAIVDNEEVKSFVLTNNHDVDDGMNLNSTIIKAIMENNTQKTIYSYYYNFDLYGHDPDEYKETQLLKLEIQKEEISTLGLFFLDLPTENPYETGRLWIDNDILKISKSLTDNE